MAHSIRRLIHAAILAVVVMMFTTSAHQAMAAITASQQSNTLAFLQGFPSALKTLSWTGTDYCSWDGITCDANGYASINLSGRNLNGFMPGLSDGVNGAEVAITSIDLSSNSKITGNFKDDWAALKTVESVDLSNTGLYGNLPDAWNGMTALKTIKVRNALACRSLPNWNISTLETVDLAKNNMGGALASSWSSMKALKSVDLTGNSFCACVPSTWTSSVLKNAAAAIGGNLVAANCGTSNQCGKNAGNCPSTKNAAVAPAQLTVAVVATLAAAMAVLGL